MTPITQFADSQKASVETILGLSNQAFAGIEQLTTLNLQVLKTTLSESFEITQAALSVTSFDDLLKLYTAALQAAPQKVLAYGRQVQDILTTLTAEQRAAFEAQISSAQAQFVETVTGAMKQSPGSESALALVKSAIATANNAYDSVSKASKQVSDAVAANVATVTETATKAVRSPRTKLDA